MLCPFCNSIIKREKSEPCRNAAFDELFAHGIEHLFEFLQHDFGMFGFKNQCRSQSNCFLATATNQDSLLPHAAHNLIPIKCQKNAF